MKKPLSIGSMLTLCSAMLILPEPAVHAGVDPAKGTPAVTRVVAVIPPDAPPTYYLDKQTGKAAGFAVDIMDAVAARAGLSITYVFEDSWADIIEMMKTGKADLAPGMGVSRERERDLAFSTLIDAFPISFFVRTEHPGIEASSGVHTVGVIRGSVAFEKLKERANIHLVLYEGFPQGLFDLLAGKIEAFACPAPTLRQLARETGVEDHIKVADKPIAEITRAIAVRKNDRALLDRLNAAIGGYVGTPGYQQLYVKWYGKPVPYWTEGRIITVGAALLLSIIALMAGWRYQSVVRLNRDLTRTMEDLRESEQKYHALVASANDALLVHLIDKDCLPGLFQEVNEIACRRYGYSRDEFLKLSPQDINDPGSFSAHIAQTIERLRTTGSAVFETVHLAKDGRRIPVEVSARVVQLKGVRHLIALARDITERKKAEETIKLNQDRLESLVMLSQRRTENTQELLDFALEEAIRLTRSRIGYLYFYNEEKREFTLNTWSREVMKECTIAEPQTIYQLDKTGIWGEAVRQRKPIVVQDFDAPHPLKKGYPPGHVPLRSFLTVPLFQQDRIVAVVGVANKEAAYGQDDISQLTLLMDAVWRMAEHKKMETELQEHAAVLRSFLNAITESALLMDKQGRVLAANETVAKRLGTTVPGIIGRCVYDLIPPEVAERRKARIDAVFNTGRPDRFEDERQGVIIDNSVYPVFDPQGGVAAVAIIGIDVTERKQVEAALQKSEKQIRDIAATVGEGLYVLDDNGRVTFMNPEAERLLGWTERELMDRNIHDVVHNCMPDGTPLSFEACRMHSVIRTGERFSSHDEVFIRKDGSIFPVSVISMPLKEDGQVTASVTAFRDISDLKKSEQEREKIIQELQKALAEIKTLHGILPICASCKKIRDDSGAWHQIEAYIRDHSDAEFSHGLCADCAKKLYPEFLDGKK